MATYKLETVKIVNGMMEWRKFGTSQGSNTRSQKQIAFDSGVFAAAEFVRRLTGDETLALQIHALLTPCDTDTIGLPIPGER